MGHSKKTRKRELRECPKHGLTEFVEATKKKDGTFRYRCAKCRVDAVSKRRKELKRLIVEYKGGKCLDCGLETDKYGLYDLHHRDPNEKDFSLGQGGLTRSLEKLKEEADKCDLLCSNCHRLRHILLEEEK